MMSDELMTFTHKKRLAFVHKCYYSLIKLGFKGDEGVQQHHRVCPPSTCKNRIIEYYVG